MESDDALEVIGIERLKFKEHTAGAEILWKCLGKLDRLVFSCTSRQPRTLKIGDDPEEIREIKQHEGFEGRDLRCLEDVKKDKGLEISLSVENLTLISVDI